MKLKERKGNEPEKEVKPVKKSVALVLTIVTVFLFAVACFSLGFCSGKKVNEAYAMTNVQATYTIEKGEYKGIDTPSFFGSNINQQMTFQANNKTYQELRIRPARNNIIYWDEALEYGYTAYNGAWQENSADIYVHENATATSSFYNWFTANFKKKEATNYIIEAGTYQAKDVLTSVLFPVEHFAFSSNGTANIGMEAVASTYYTLRYYQTEDDYRNAYGQGGWLNQNLRMITVNSPQNVGETFYNWFLANFEEYVPPSSYTCTLSKNTSGMYSFGYIEGEGVTYDENTETIEGPADSYFQVQLMPFEGYMVDTFLLTASNGSPKSIVKNSDTLYTVTFEEDDFTLNISASVKPITYTLTIQFEGGGFTHTATPTGTSEQIIDNVFECDAGSGAYVAIGPQDDYIIEEISYNVDSGVATIQESGINGYRVLRNSGNAVVTFTVTTKTDTVVIPSGYYWLKSLSSHPNFSTRYTIVSGDFQAIKSIENGSIVWENLIAFVPYNETSPYFYFASAPSVGVQVFAPGSYRIVSVPSGVSNPYPSPVALYYPVVYVPEDIKESRGYSSTLISFMTEGAYTYKSDIQYYNAFYVELPSAQASIPISLPSAFDGLTLYTPSQNTLISPQSVSLTNMNNVVIGEWTIYYVVDFAGNPDRGEYTGAWFGIQGGQKRSVYNQLDPFFSDGNIYINSTVMPTSAYSFLNSAFNISAVPIDVDPPSPDYWIGLDTVLSYQIFGIPLSVLLAVVISSVFVVVVIRLFAGG